MSLFSASIRSAHFSPNYGADLLVTSRAFGLGATADEVTRGVVAAEVVELSADGRSWVDGWHDAKRHGAESTEAVYVEKHTRGGAVFHGWVDSVSRRVVQTG